MGFHILKIVGSPQILLGLESGIIMKNFFLLLYIFLFSHSLSAVQYDQEEEKKLKYEHVQHKEGQVTWDKVESVLAREWHQEKGRELQCIIKEVGEFYRNYPRPKKPNIATFMIDVEYCFLENSGNFFSRIQRPNVFFLSGGFFNGGNQNLQDFLNNSEKNRRIISIRDYCPQEEGKTEDYGLRKRICEIFEFQEVINIKKADEVRKEFVRLLRATQFEGGDFNIALGANAIDKISKICTSTLEYRFFTNESNEKAKRIRLYDKRKKEEELEHINNLFDSSLSLQFGDSEQAILMFFARQIEKNPSLLGYDFMMNNLYNSFIKTYPELGEKESALSSINVEEKKNHRNFIEMYKKTISEVAPHLINFIKEKINIHFNMASYYDICRNCRATFDIEIYYNSFFQKHIISEVCKDFLKNRILWGVKEIKNLKHQINKCVNELAFEYNKTMVSLNNLHFLCQPSRSFMYVSSLEEYQVNPEEIGD